VSCDNRRFLRVPAGDGHPKGIVRLEGNRTLSCEVLNKSLGGYGLGVPIDSAAAFPPGRILVLEVDDLVVQVKVAHAMLDPDDDRYLIGLERIAELEDRLAQQSQISWMSALWPARHGLGGQSNMLRDLVLATLFCSSLLLFTCLPKFTESKGKKKTRTTSSAWTFSFPWSWRAARTYIPKLPTSEGIEAALTAPVGSTGVAAAPGGMSAGTSSGPAAATGVPAAAPPK
jgi:hypothetical protein